MRPAWLALPCALSLSLPGRAEQADMPRSQEAFDLLAPDTMADARPRWRAATAQPGAAWGGFLVWPSVGVAAVVDSNPLQAHAGGSAAAGLRLTPHFAAERQSGVHATVVYGAADARLYPARPDADQLDGRIGVLHDWAPRRDLILRLQGDVSQARDTIDSPAAIAGVAARHPLTARVASVAGSVQKTASAFFVTLGGGAAHAGFTEAGLRTTAGTRAISDETRLDLRARVGARLGPFLLAFAEPAANWRTLDAAPARSHGTRLIAGLGTDGAALLSGEAFAGVQRQDYTLRPRTTTEPVFGARLAWTPDPAWIATAEAGRGLEQTAVAAARQPLGTPIDVTQETVALHATPSRAWAGELALEHAAVRYLGTGRRDDLLQLRAGVVVPWRHDLDILADLALTRVRSSLVAASYRQAVASLGLRYRY